MTENSDNNDLRHQIFEGQLNKFTNVVKGWQYRWFVVRPETGFLDYHLMEDITAGATLLGKEPTLKIGKCRGSQHLAGCMVVPSEEDSLTFTAIFVSGESYKLRASNVKERQVWVDRLRAVAHLHDKAIAHTHPPVMASNRHPTPPPGGKSQLTSKGEPTESLQNLSLSVLEAFGSVHDILHQVDLKHRTLKLAIERLPLYGPSKPLCVDDDLLTIKATSQAALLSLESSLGILQDIVENAAAMTVGHKPSKVGTKSPLALSPKKVLPDGDTLRPLQHQTNLSSSTPAVNQTLAKIDESSDDKVSTASADEQFHDSRQDS